MLTLPLVARKYRSPGNGPTVPTITMKKNLIPQVCAFLLFCLASCGGSSDSTSVDAAGKHNENLLESTGKPEQAGWFVANMASCNTLEAELGRLASSKGNDPRVKELGQLLLNHHTQLNTQLKQIADLKNLITPTSLSNDHQQIFNNILEKSGASFDQAYLEAIIKNHKDTIDEFQEMADEGEDTEIRNFSIRSLPTLQAHLTQAEALENALKG